MRRATFTLLSLLVIGMSAQAGSVLDGKALRVEVRYPHLGRVEGSPHDITVGPGLEIPSIGGVNVQLDFSDTQILMSATKGFAFPTVDFNGYAITDLADNVPSFGNVTINTIVDWSGFSAANVSFDANNIYIDVGGSTTLATGSILFDVSSVPLPSAALAGLGLLGGLAVVRRLRRQRAP